MSHKKVIIVVLIGTMLFAITLGILHTSAQGEFREFYTFYYPGFNLRSTDLNAFLGLSQIKKMNDIAKKRAPGFPTTRPRRLRSLAVDRGHEYVPHDSADRRRPGSIYYPRSKRKPFNLTRSQRAIPRQVFDNT